MSIQVPVFSVDGKKVGSVSLPVQFEEVIQEVTIAKAVSVQQSNARQAYGASPIAGMQHSTRWSKRRRDYRGVYGKGISRIPRKIMFRRGSQIMGVGAEMPGTVGGRKAHPPKAEKIWAREINRKEKRVAVRSALHASAELEQVQRRHRIMDGPVPFVVRDLEKVRKAGDMVKLMVSFGLQEEIERVKEKKIRAGKGTMRGRKYRRKVGPLLVTTYAPEFSRGVRNLAGIDTIEVRNLNAQALAPGRVPGRLLIISEDAVKEMEEKKLFMEVQKDGGK